MTVVNESLSQGDLLGWEYREVMAQCPVAYFGDEIYCHYKPARKLRSMSQFVATCTHANKKVQP